jgi:3-phenylpropionate/trans-cinnamate dioxygenase ferredoxin reductase subunit
MSDIGTVVVVGAGLAGGKAVERLRADGFDGRLVLAGQERHRPYERPPLSKGYLLGNDPLDSVYLHDPDWYERHQVELRLDSPATDLDLEARTLTVADEPIAWDRLLLATGSRPRPLPVEHDEGSVAYLRTIEDSTRLKDGFRPGRRVVVIGAGWIGLEAAAAARAAGCEVTVLEALAGPLLRVVGPEVSEVFAALHRSHGVRLLTGVGVAGIRRTPAHTEVQLADGTVVVADLVVAGVGVAPAVELAQRAGLTTDNGIVVDQRLRTSHPQVFAAGDVANAFHPTLGRHVRVEHWDNAIEQGRHAAGSLLGSEESYQRLPYFFTDQYDLGMEYVGHVGPEGYDEVVIRGDVPGLVFAAFWLARGRVVAGMQVNDWDAMDAVRRVVAAGDVDVRALRDPATSWDQLSG